MENNQRQNKQSIDRMEKRISSKLRQARLAHHYSLRRIFNVTKIQTKYLIDIDKGNFSKLPGNFYIRAFIKKYADSVGLNGEELLRDYNNKLPDPQDPHYMNQISRNRLFTRVRNQHRLEKRIKVRQYIPVMTIVIIVLILLISGWLISTQHHSNTNTYNHSTVSFSGTFSHKLKHHQKKYQKHLLDISSIKGTKVIYRVPLNQKNHIKLLSSHNSKIIIKNNDHYVTNTTLRAHREKNVLVHLKGERQLSINIKNYPGINIIVNNRSLEKESKVKNPTIILK